MRSLAPSIGLLSLACAALAVAAQDEGLHRPPGYPGQLLFYEVSEVTIVYPASHGEDAARNRLSAVQRARFLESTSRMKTRVISDAEATEADLAGHLLLLGWGNRLLGSGPAVRPFERSGTGTRFLGIVEPDPDLDLMFFHPSPYNPERYLLFWSRMDPPRDRFMPLPMVGSDWAFYRDFKIVRQGMLRPGNRWPPERDPEAEKDHAEDLASLEARDARKRGARYELVYDPAKLGAEEAEAILRVRETALVRAASALGVSLDGYRATLFVYADTDAKKMRTGVPDAAHALPARREAHMTRTAARSASLHEEVHLLAQEAFGPCAVTSLYEGLAVSVEGAHAGTDLATRGAILLDRGVFPDLAEVLAEERMRKGPADVTLPAAGLLVSWIRETGGREGLARAYAMPDGTVEALAKALGRPPAELQADFRGWLAERAASRKSELAFTKAEAEAKDRYLAGDFAGVAAALAKALAARPGDPQTLFNLASAQMRTGDYQEAERNLKRLLEARLEGPNAHFEIFAHYQLGRLYDIQGRRADALAEYRRVLELPDRHDAHRLAREAIEQPVTKEQLQ